jgi:hypothetical protein
VEPIIQARSGVLKVGRCRSLRFIVAPVWVVRNSGFSRRRTDKWHPFLEDLARGAVIQRLVQPLGIIELRVGRDRLAGLGNALIGSEMDLFVLEAAREPLAKVLSLNRPRPSRLLATDGCATPR